MNVDEIYVAGKIPKQRWQHKSMAQIVYCWRCKKDLPMLDEAEWDIVAPHLSHGIEQIKQYRQDHNASITEARQLGYGQEALAAYSKITGYKENDADVLWHHRLSKFGPPCQTCGKLLRTPKAKFCAECGAMHQV